MFQASIDHTTTPHPGSLIGDAISAGAVAGSLLGHYLGLLSPAISIIAGLAGLMWFFIQIWDWWRTRKQKERIARAQLAVLEAELREHEENALERGKNK